MKTGGLLYRLALLAGILAAWSFSAGAMAAPMNWSEKIAVFLRGRFVLEGDTMYFVSEAHAQVDGSGKLTFEMQVDPIYQFDFLAEDLDAGGSAGHYLMSIRQGAACGPEGAATRIEDAASVGLSVRKGNDLIDLHDVLRNAFPRDAASLPYFPSNVRPASLSEADWRRVRACEESIADRAAALPFSRVEVYAGRDKLAEVFRPRADSLVVGLGVGEDIAVTAVAVKADAEKVADFSVEVQAVSSVTCDYEGPHVELDNWKQGFSAPKNVRRKGDKFVIDPGVLEPVVAPIPAYTGKELRRAINAHSGQPGMSTPEEAKPCSPNFRGYRFTVKYQGRAVYRIDVYEAGGC